MTECMLCHNEMLDEQKISATGEDHQICIQEWHKRHESNKCVRCGTNKIRDMLNNKCINCNIDDDFVGYEGPQS